MLADYLSFPMDVTHEIAAFNLFQPNLRQLQNQDPELQAIFQFLKTCKWLPRLT
jgi:hypothetical protein